MVTGTEVQSMFAEWMNDLLSGHLQHIFVPNSAHSSKFEAIFSGQRLLEGFKTANFTFVSTRKVDEIT